MGLSDGPGDWGLAGGGLWTLEVAYLHLLPSHHDYLPPVTNNNECKDNPGSSRVGGRQETTADFGWSVSLGTLAAFTTVVMAKVGCSRQL